MSKKTIYLTSEGLAKLEQKLEYLKTERRLEVAGRIKAAIQLGDLSENSEYEDAKNEQAFIEGEIMSIESTLRVAQIIESNDVSGDLVTVGTNVHLKNLATGNEVSYIIVGSDEANPFDGRISNESPIGSAVMGKRVGDTVEVTLPNGGTLKLEIAKIHRP